MGADMGSHRERVAQLIAQNESVAQEVTVG
jgi:hypothetical protein